MSLHTMLAVDYAKLAGKLAAMNRKAEKLGCSPVSATVIARREREEVDSLGGVHYFSEVDVEVLGGFPHFEGWRFIATIEPTAAGNVLKVVPGETVPVQYYGAVNHCDHCGTNRWRKETFVLGDNDENYVQVGRNCLADFLGSDMTPARLAAIAEFGFDVRGEDSWDGFGGGGELELDANSFLADVTALARFEGFVTGKRAREEGCDSTAMRAFRLGHDAQFQRELEKSGFQVTDKDVETAKAARAWGQAQAGDTDFSHNMRVVCTLPTVTWKKAGILGYAVEGMRRDAEREKVAAVAATAPAVEHRHLGQVGARVAFPNLQVVRIQEFDGDYGVSCMVRMLDPDGNTVIWWTTSDIGWLEEALEYDQVVSLVGTVKKHDEFRGEPQTVITRAKRG